MIKILIDTNVIIDYLANREPYADQAERIIDMCADGEVTGIITANSVTDIYYIMQKQAGRSKAMDGLRALLDVLDIAEVGKRDILNAADLNMDDFEDALVATCAKRINAQYIISRNIKDYSNSPVSAIMPQKFLTQ